MESMRSHMSPETVDLAMLWVVRLMMVMVLIGMVYATVRLF